MKGPEGRDFQKLEGDSPPGMTKLVSLVEGADAGDNREPLSFQPRRPRLQKPFGILWTLKLRAGSHSEGC